MDARPNEMIEEMPPMLTPAEIDALMAIPPRPMPSIFVVGDDVVSSITFPQRLSA